MIALKDQTILLMINAIYDYVRKLRNENKEIVSSVYTRIVEAEEALLRLKQIAEGDFVAYRELMLAA